MGPKPFHAGIDKKRFSDKWNRGDPVSDICEWYCVSPRTVQKTVDAFGLKHRPKGKKMAEIDPYLLRDLWLSGMRIKNIARIVRQNYSTTYAAIKRLHLPRRNRILKGGRFTRRTPQMLVTSGVLNSCLVTSLAASKKDDRQKLPDKFYVDPGEAARLLSAQLLIEEAFETVKALGFTPTMLPDGEIHLEANRPFNMLEAIDGACDTIYVATQVFAKIGAPDLAHLNQVCVANDSKFPGGEAIVDEATGKYLKPPGWKGPDHEAVRKAVFAKLAKHEVMVAEKERELVAYKATNKNPKIPAPVVPKPWDFLSCANVLTEMHVARKMKEDEEREELQKVNKSKK